MGAEEREDVAEVHQRRDARVEEQDVLHLRAPLGSRSESRWRAVGGALQSRYRAVTEPFESR